MGIFDFIKSAGKKLGFGDDEAPTGDALKKELDSHQLGTEKVEVEVKGDKAVIRGDVGSQEALEKAIVAVGNTIGIRQVEVQREGRRQRSGRAALPRTRAFTP